MFKTSLVVKCFVSKCLKCFKPRQMGVRISDYDCVGFDLDNTLVLYNLPELCNLQYNLLADKMVQLGYNPKFLSLPLSDGIDFIRRGLILDMDRGNVLDIAYDGTIINGSHGTKMLNSDQIKEIYGNDSHWNVTDSYVQDYLVSWEGALAQKMRATYDYFDIAMPLIYARAVDSVDFESSGTTIHYNEIWDHILCSVSEMYSRFNFEKNYGGFFSAIKDNPTRYVDVRSTEVSNWLKKVKENRVTFLVTGSYVDFANLVAETTLGKNWRDYFDIIIYYARKPGFFIGNRPFLNIVDDQEMEEQTTDFRQKCYSQGNWKDMYAMLKDRTKKSNPTVLYVGDNLIQDIYAPVHYLGIDTIAIVPEVLHEVLFKSRMTVNSPEMYTSSSLWGSYIKNEKDGKLKVWGKIISCYSKFCINDITSIIGNPLDYSYNVFNFGDESNNNINGYYPKNLISN